MKFGTPFKRVKLNRTAVKSLRSIAALPFEACTFHLIPPSNYTLLTTDASEYGWAAVYTDTLGERNVA